VQAGAALTQCFTVSGAHHGNLTATDCVHYRTR
jgi:hypothetical protein